MPVDLEAISDFFDAATAAKLSLRAPDGSVVSLEVGEMRQALAELAEARERLEAIEEAGAVNAAIVDELISFTLRLAESGENPIIADIVRSLEAILNQEQHDPELIELVRNTMEEILTGASELTSEHAVSLLNVIQAFVESDAYENGMDQPELDGQLLEQGPVLNVAAMAARAQSNGHVDAVQAVGLKPVRGAHVQPTGPVVRDFRPELAYRKPAPMPNGPGAAAAALGLRLRGGRIDNGDIGEADELE